MLWTLWDILIPLLITFALGLCLGWLLWRWRRRRVSATDVGADATTLVAQADDDGVAEQLRHSTDQLAQVRRELEIERNSNQLLKNKVDDLRQLELAQTEDGAEAGVVVDTSKVELEVGLVQAEKDRDLLRAKLDECQRKGQAMNDEIASLETRVHEHEERNQLLSSDLETALSARSDAEARLENSAAESDTGDGAEGQAADAAARIAELERQLEQAQGALAQNDSTVLRTRLDEAEAQLRARGEALEGAEQQLARANQAMEQADSASQGLLAESSSTDSGKELDAMRATVEQRDARIAELERSLETLEKDNGVADESSGDTENKLVGWGTATDQSPVSARYNADRRTDTASAADTGGGEGADSGRSQSHGSAGDSAPDSAGDAGGAAGNTSSDASSDASREVPASDDSGSLDSSANHSGAESTFSASADQQSSSSVVSGSGSTNVQADRSADSVSKNTGGGATASGYVPIGWEVPGAVPDKKERDKLTDIKGIGPKLEGVLHANGIYFFRQIAQLDADGLDELQEQMPEFRGRIQRDNWQGQAVDLHREKYGEAP